MSTALDRPPKPPPPPAGAVTGPADWQAAGVSIDSRSVKPGDLFVALRGPELRRP